MFNPTPPPFTSHTDCTMFLIVPSCFSINIFVEFAIVALHCFACFFCKNTEQIMKRCILSISLS